MALAGSKNGRDAVQLAGENRTGLVGIAIDGDDGMDRLLHKLFQVLRAMAGNINACFSLELDSERTVFP